MSFRFRLGPLTFGPTGVRLSLWGRRSGVSIPLSGKGRSFGKIGLGPLRWFFSGSAKGGKAGNDQQALIPYEKTAIESIQSDQDFLEKLSQFGMPWRGVQERIKKELPNSFSDQDGIAYSLVPKALDAIFGDQETAWKTEKRASKSGSGYTTWVVIINRGA